MVENDHNVPHCCLVKHVHLVTIYCGLSYIFSCLYFISNPLLDKLKFTNSKDTFTFIVKVFHL